MKITFTRDTTPFEGGPHKQGETLECSEASAQRWIRRDAAVPASEAPPAKSIEAPPADKSVKAPPKDKSVKAGDTAKK